MSTPSPRPASRPQTLRGVVIQAGKMHKTVTVLVERLIWHKKLHKQFRRSKAYLVHDENAQAQIGDQVTIEQTRPLSRRKHFRIAARLSSPSVSDKEAQQ